MNSKKGMAMMPLFFVFLVTFATCLSPEIIKELEESRKVAFSYAYACTFEGLKPYSEVDHGEFFWATFPNGGKICADGDSTLWNGLLCLSGSEFGCRAVYMMQDDDGRVWRSPARIGKPNDTFSRDMGEGALAAAFTTNNVTFMRLWRDYVVRTGGLCPYIKCMITPSFYCIFNFVAERLGLEVLPRDIVVGNVTESFCTDGSWDVLEVIEATTDDLGFPLHLVVSRLLILQKAGYWSENFQRAVEELTTRQPLNGLFKYSEKGATDDVAKYAMSLLPEKKPDIGNQWCWQRKDSEETWKETSGFDFVYLFNLLLGDFNSDKPA